MDARAALRTACAYLPLAKTFGAFIPNIIIQFKMFVMQTCAMKACFQIAECSFSSAKISNIPVTSKYLAGYFILFSIKTSI